MFWKNEVYFNPNPALGLSAEAVENRFFNSSTGKLPFSMEDPRIHAEYDGEILSVVRIEEGQEGHPTALPWAYCTLTKYRATPNKWEYIDPNEDPYQVRHHVNMWFTHADIIRAVEYTAGKKASWSWQIQFLCRDNPACREHMHSREDAKRRWEELPADMTSAHMTHPSLGYKVTWDGATLTIYSLDCESKGQKYTIDTFRVHDVFIPNEGWKKQWKSTQMNGDSTLFEITHSPVIDDDTCPFSVEEVRKFSALIKAEQEQQEGP